MNARNSSDALRRKLRRPRRSEQNAAAVDLKRAGRTEAVHRRVSYHVQRCQPSGRETILAAPRLSPNALRDRLQRPNGHGHSRSNDRRPNVPRDRSSRKANASAVQANGRDQSRSNAHRPRRNRDRSKA